MRYQFDRFELDYDRSVLLDVDNDAQLALRPQAFSVLGYLLQRAPDLVDRKELLNAVWGHTALSPSGIAQAVREIRRVLGDEASAPRILATRHGKGYQIVAPVTRVHCARTPGVAFPAPEQAPAAEARTAAPEPGRVAAALALAGLLPVLALVLALWLTNGSGAAAYISERHYVAESLPKGARARDAWQAGMQARARLDRPAAIDALAGAVTREPDAAAIRFDLAAALLDFDQPARARAVLAHPTLQQGLLSQRERLRLRSLIALADGDGRAALGALSSLADFFPGTREYQLALFDVQRRLGATEDAARTFRRLERDAALMAATPRLRLAGAELLLLKGELGAARARARAMISAIDPDRAPGAAGFARIVMARVALAEDRPGRAWQLAEQAEALLRALEDPAARAEALALVITAAARISGVPPARVETVCRLRGELEMPLVEGLCQWARGLAALESDDLAGAVERFEAAEALLRRGGRPVLAIDSRLAAARALYRAGRLQEAAPVLANVSAALRRAGDPGGRARADAWSARVLFALGRFEDADRSWQDAGMNFARAGLALESGVALIGRAEAARAQGRLDAYETHSDQAAEVLRALAGDGTAPDRRAQGWLALAAGREAHRCGELDSALGLLERAVDQLDPRRAADYRAEALARIARIHIEQVELGRAGAALARAHSLAGLSHAARQRLDEVAVRLALVEGRYREAGEMAAALFDTPPPDSSPRLARRARLLMVHVLAESGRPEAAEALLRELQRGLSFEQDAGLFADTVLTRARLALRTGQHAVARHELDRLDGVDLWRLDVGLELRARQLEAELLDPGAAVPDLAGLRERAASAGYRLAAMEADVVLAQKLRESGDPSGGDALASIVRERARARGAHSVVDSIDGNQRPAGAGRH